MNHSLLLEVARQARVVAGSLDGDTRALAAGTLRDLLGTHPAQRRVGEAMLMGALSHSDLCPRIAAACATREEWAFERLQEGLVRWRGADLLHVGTSESGIDEEIVQHVRVWGRATYYAVPRLALFDGGWAAVPDPTAHHTQEVLRCLMEWLRPTADDAYQRFAIGVVWREMLATSERFSRWADVLWAAWPPDAARACEHAFGAATDLHAGRRHDRPAAGVIERQVNLLAHLASIARSDATSRPALLENTLGAVEGPLAGEKAYAIGVCTVLHAAERAGCERTATRLVIAPIERALSGGAPCTEAAITGFCAGVTTGVTRANAATVALARDALAPVLRRARVLLAVENGAALDAFGRLSGAALAALVALGSLEDFAIACKSPDESPYALRRACANMPAAARHGPLDRSVTSEPMLSLVRSGRIPSAGDLVAVGVEVFGDDARWPEGARRIQLAREVSKRRLSAAKIAAILDAPDDRAILDLLAEIPATGDSRRDAVTRPASRVSPEHAASLGRRDDMDLRLQIASTLDERLRVIGDWAAAVSAAPCVTTGEATGFLAALRRVHVACFLDCSAGAAQRLETSQALAVAATQLARLDQMIVPYPPGSLFACALLALGAQASLLRSTSAEPDAERGLRDRMEDVWRRFLPDPALSLLSTDSWKLWRRALVAACAAGTAVPAFDQPRDVIACEAAFATRLYELEALIAREPDRIQAIVAGALNDLDVARVPRSAGAAQVAQLVVHLLQRRTQGIGAPLTAPDATRWVRRVRALLGGPVEPIRRLADLLPEAITSTGAPVSRFEQRIIDDRALALPYVAAFLVLEELLANAVEHGTDGAPVVIEGSEGAFIVGVTSRCDDAAGAAGRVSASSVSGSRFARAVCEAWRFRLEATPVDSTHLRVAILR